MFCLRIYTAPEAESDFEKPHAEKELFPMEMASSVPISQEAMKSSICRRKAKTSKSLRNSSARGQSLQVKSALKNCLSLSKMTSRQVPLTETLLRANNPTAARFKEFLEFIKTYPDIPADTADALLTTINFIENKKRKR